MADTIRVYVLNPGAERALPLDLPTNKKGVCNYHDLQALVGGMLDAVRLDPHLALYCNDEGLLVGMPPNVRTDNGTILVGTLVLSRCDDDGETVSATDDDLATLNAFLSDKCTRPRVDWGM